MNTIRRVALLGLFLTATTSPCLSQTAPTREQKIAAHQQKANEFLKANQPDMAIPELRAVIALDPQNVDALGNLGVLLFFKGDYANAAPLLRAAAKLKPDLWKIQALLGMSEKRTGDFAAAHATLEKTFAKLADQKTRMQVGLELIELYSSTEDLSKAAHVIDTLREGDPTNVDLLYTSYRIHSDLAHQAVLSMAVVAANSARMHQMMAHELAKQGNAAAAIANYREALKINPHLPGIHYELAEMLNSTASADQLDEAESEYRAALSENPLDLKSQCRLGDLAARRGDIKESYALYSRAVAMQPNDAEANAGLAKTLVAMNQLEKALPLLEKAVQLEPTNATTHFQLNTLYRRLGRPEDAKRELAEYQKYKDIKEKLREIYRDLRQEPADGEPKSEDARP